MNRLVSNSILVSLTAAVFLHTTSWAAGDTATDRTVLLISMRTTAEQPKEAYPYSRKRDERREFRAKYKAIIKNKDEWDLRAHARRYGDGTGIPSICNGSLHAPDASGNRDVPYRYERAPCYWIPTVQYVEDRISSALGEYFGDESNQDTEGMREAIAAAVGDSSQELQDRVVELEHQLMKLQQQLDALIERGQ